MGEQYWGLPSLAHIIRWFEEVVAILSKPFLMVGFIVSMLDLLTQGRLLNVPLVVYGWALIQAVAVDATFFVVWYKVKKAVIARQWLQFIGFVILGLALGIVAWAAMDIQSLEQALGIANTEALARLNLNPVLLTHLRSLVAVIMGGVVAMIAPEENRVSSKQQLNTSWSPWLRSIGRRLGMKIRPDEQVVTPPPLPPIEHPEDVNTNPGEQSVPVLNSHDLTPPYTPLSEHFAGDWSVEIEHPDTEQAEPFSFMEYTATKVEDHARPVTTPVERPAVEHQPTKGRQLHVVDDSTPEARVRQAYAEHGPEVTDRKLARIASVSPATAGKWKGVIEQEEKQLAVNSR